MHVVIRINPIFQRAHMSYGDKCYGEKYRIMGLVQTARRWGGNDIQPNV